MDCDDGSDLLVCRLTLRVDRLVAKVAYVQKFKLSRLHTSNTTQMDW
jgi:hypothetical protein